MCTLCVSVLCINPKSQFFIFTFQKSTRILREFFCRPLHGISEIETFVQYPSNIPKYTISDPYWMQNNIFYITFKMHNNLNITIKLFSTIYLSLAVLFNYVASYWHNESWVHKPWNIFHDTKKGSTSNIHFSTTITSLRTILTL